MAARRHRGGDRGHRSDRAEEPRVRGHRGGPAAERAVRRRRRRRSSTRSSARPATSRRGRARRSRPSPAARWSSPVSAESRRRSSSRRSRSRPDCCSCCSRCCGWVGSRSFLSKAVVTGFLAGAAIDVVVGELPKLTGTSAEGDNAWREFASWLGSLGDMHWTTVLVGVTALARDPRAAARRAGDPRRARARRRRAARLGAVRPRRARRGARRRRAARASRSPSCPISSWSGDHYRDRSPSRRWRLLLIGFSQTAGDARAFAARHRYRIDVNQESVGAGDGERRRGRVPGNAGVDEPLGELAERVGGRADAGRLARDRGPRARDAARPRAAVLGAAEGGARAP